MSDAMMRLEGETFVRAELLRRSGGLTDDEVKALALGMIGGVGDYLVARLGCDRRSVVELPAVDGRLKLVWTREDVTIVSIGDGTVAS